MSNERAQQVFNLIYSEILGEYWSPRRKLVEREYVDLEPQNLINTNSPPIAELFPSVKPINTCKTSPAT